MSKRTPSSKVAPGTAYSEIPMISAVLLDVSCAKTVCETRTAIRAISDLMVCLGHTFHKLDGVHDNFTFVISLQRNNSVAAVGGFVNFLCVKVR